MDYCYATGDVYCSANKGNVYVGGLVGYTYYSGAYLRYSLALGNIGADLVSDSYNIYVGNVGYCNYSRSKIMCYAYEGQIIDIDKNRLNTQHSDKCSIEDINNPEFYLVTLGFATKNWDVSSINAENGIFPTLIKNTEATEQEAKVYYQFFISSSVGGKSVIDETI